MSKCLECPEKTVEPLQKVADGKGIMKHHETVKQTMTAAI
jgi:hypothetical protein